MSMDKTARTHTNQSNRASAREAAQRRVVFKGVLDNPFTLRWPTISENVQNVFLARLVAIMEGVAEYHLSRKKKKPARRAKPQRKVVQPRSPVESASESMDIDTAAPPAPASENAGDEQVMPAPAILAHLVIGINQVTKRLESQAKRARQTYIGSSSDSSTAVHAVHSPLHVVFVCCDDIDPPLLVAHIPTLVASCNSAPHARLDQEFIRLVPLAKNSEFTLAAALGLRRVSVIAIDCDAPHLTPLRELLDSVPRLAAAWLTPQFAQVTTDKTLEPTHIKQLRTTAPKDMKAAKEDRAKARAAAKEKRKQNPQPLTRRRGRTADKRRKSIKLSTL